MAISPRFRRNAFGWKSQPPIQRIKEALAEIKAAARTGAVLAAEGGVLFLEKLAPAIAQVDSSSGSIGSAVNRAIDMLAALVASLSDGCWSGSYRLNIVIGITYLWPGTAKSVLHVPASQRHDSGGGAATLLMGSHARNCNSNCAESTGLEA